LGRGRRGCVASDCELVLDGGGDVMSGGAALA
jgi:hypothetical protein